MNDDPEVLEIKAAHLHCHRCGKQVSTPFFPVPTKTPDRGLIVRAHIECPECIETEIDRLAITEARAREAERRIGLVVLECAERLAEERDRTVAFVDHYDTHIATLLREFSRNDPKA